MLRLVLTALVFGFLSSAAHADTLDDIRHRGHLVCAVNIDTDDYSDFDSHGDVSAFETGYCRAYAAAIIGDPARATVDRRGDEITGLRDVRDHHADLMIGATPDPALGLGLHLAFAPPILIDGQGFIVSASLGIRRVAEIGGARVCYVGSTPEETLVHDRLGERGVAFAAFEFSERGEMEGALATNHCNLITGDLTELANIRLSLPGLKNFTILPETITTDPLAPAVRDGDTRLLAIVAAVDAGLLDAEEHAVTRANAATLAHTSGDPIVRRLLGADGWIGPALGLDGHWLLRAVQAEGNHAEIYARDVGASSKLSLPVGPNAPIAEGGALTTTPVGAAR